MYTPNDKVLAIYKSPFVLGSPLVEQWEPGITISEIVDRMPGVPKNFKEFGEVRINGHVVDPKYWNRIKPAKDSKDHEVAVTLHTYLQGGKENNKSVFALIAAIALSYVTAGIAAGSAAGWLGPAFKAGTLGAKLLAGAVSLTGALLIAALTAPPVNKNQDSSGTSNPTNASAQGNALEAGGSIPQVIGTMKTFPPFAHEPYIELIEQAEYVQATYILAGNHRLSHIKLGDNDIDPNLNNTSDFFVETRSGFATEEELLNDPIQTKTIEYNQQMSTHDVSTDAPDTLNPIGLNLPTWHGISTRADTDEVWIHLQVSGLARNADPTQHLRIPFRIKVKLRGTTVWRNLPELHFAGNLASLRRTQIKLHFGDYTTINQPLCPRELAFVEARKFSPAQTISPLGTTFVADSYFGTVSSSVTADDALYYGNESTSDVLFTDLNTSGVDFYLDRASWPSGIYDIQIIRGMTIIDANYDPATYNYNGPVGNIPYDLFNYFGSKKIALSRDGLVDNISIVRSVSIWRQKAINVKGNTLISIRAKDRALDALSVIASGYAYEYGGYNIPGSVDLSMTANTTSASIGTTVNAQNVAFRCNVTLPEIPIDGNIFDTGISSSTRRALIGVRNNGLTFYVQAGGYSTTNFASDSGRAVLEVPAEMLPFDGQVHLIALEIRPGAPGTVRLWVDQVYIGSATTTAGAALDGSVWASNTPIHYLTSWSDLTGATNLAVLYNRTVNDSDASWRIKTTSRNPATWYREVLTGQQNYNPMPNDLIDDETLLIWRQRCFQNNYTCDLIAGGDGIDALLKIIASTAYASPYQAELWGVIQDYDRSSEQPVQIFASNNSRGFSASKGFPILPGGLRISYPEMDNDYINNEVIVLREGIEQTTNLLERVTYRGIVQEAKAITRGLFDIAQAQYRTTFYDLETQMEWIRCRKGSLVLLENDVLDHHYDRARIVSYTQSGSNITQIVLDHPVMVYKNSSIDTITDISAVTDISESGVTTGITIRNNNGDLITLTISNSAGETNTLNISPAYANPLITGGPFDSGSIRTISEENLVIIGAITKLNKRMIVYSIIPQEDLEAKLILVDEAPEIWSAIA